MTVYYFKEDFRNVTEFYYNIILDDLMQKGVECKMLDKCNWGAARNIQKTDLRFFRHIHHRLSSPDKDCLLCRYSGRDSVLQT